MLTAEDSTLLPPAHSSEDCKAAGGAEGSQQPKTQRVLLPPNLVLAAAHLAQLRAQIQGYKLIKLKLPLASDLLRLTQRVTPADIAAAQSHVQLQLMQLAAYRRWDEQHASTLLSVPGDLERKDDAYFRRMRCRDPTTPSAERAMLQLETMQAKVRASLLEEFRMRASAKRDQSSAVLETALIDREFYRRSAAATTLKARQEQKTVTKFEQAMRNGLELRKKNRQRELVADLMNFHKEFFEYHRKKYAAQKKLAYHAKARAEYLEKREQIVKDKMERERIKRLKEDDLGGYMELVNSAKNNRLLDILNQTDSFLRELGAKVKLQKGDISTEDSDQGDSAQDLSGRLKFSSQLYYKLTHSVAEEVKQQPEGIEGGTLKPYQMVGLQWLVSLYNNNLHGILADEMGLGKTIQAIALLQFVIEKKKNYGPFLIIVPLSTLSNWVMEMSKWAPGIRKVVYRGPPSVRRRIINTMKARKFNALISTYEYVIKDKHALNKFHWAYIIVDEGHRMKNAKSKFAQILGQQYQSDHRLLLTGTPLQNNLAELWALLNFLLPKIFHSLDDFEKWFNQPLVGLTGEKQAALNEEETLLIINRLHQVLRPFLLRRVKKEVESELPDKVENVIKVELSSWQRALYDKIHERTYIGRDAATGRLKNLNNSVMQLRKVCNHPYLFYPEPTFEVNDDIWRSSGKFELLDRILPKLLVTGHQMLIFCQMTQLMDIMERYFEYRHFSHLRLDGTTKSEDRDKRMALFNEQGEKYPIFLLSTRAGGLGLNLQAADTVIIFDSDWNPMMDLQAQDRAHRIGQKREVRVFRLVTNTKIEETILTRASLKKKLDGKVIQAGLFNNKSTDKERQEKLRIFLQRDEQTEDEERTVLNDEEVNEMLARSDQEFEVFQTFDRDRKATDEYSKTGTRLIMDAQLPTWIEEEEEDEKQKEELVGPNTRYGRGSRARKRVSYAEEADSDEDRPTSETEESTRKRKPESASEPQPQKKAKLETRRSTTIKITTTGLSGSRSESEGMFTEEGIRVSDSQLVDDGESVFGSSEEEELANLQLDQEES